MMSATSVSQVSRSVSDLSESNVTLAAESAYECTKVHHFFQRLKKELPAFLFGLAP